jgi:hypothetical protein
MDKRRQIQREIREKATANTIKKLLKKFRLKYETIFKWMLVGVNKREAFWDLIKRDAANNKLDCYEIRLEEVVNSFTSVTRKYWKNQRGIAARKKRTMLFKSDVFRQRRTEKSYGWETFGNREGSFAKKILWFVREQMLSKAGLRLEGEQWEETLLYAIAINGDVFGTAMMGLSENQNPHHCQNRC